jgi:hypothetical protein
MQFAGTPVSNRISCYPYTPESRPTSPGRARSPAGRPPRNGICARVAPSPALVWLADLSFYLLLMERLGPVAAAVTTNLTINFMRKPEPADLLGEGRLMKLGRALAVGDFTIWSEGEQEPVAHATLTYSLPRTAKKG